MFFFVVWADWIFGWDSCDRTPERGAQRCHGSGFEGSRGCSLGDLFQPPEVVGSMDNSSGRASWRCSSWNWANAVKPLPRHDHFAKWKIIFQLSKKFYKISQKSPLQKMIKKWSKNDQKTTPQKVEKTPFSLLHTPAIPAELTYRKRGGVKSSTSCWRNHINP